MWGSSPIPIAPVSTAISLSAGTIDTAGSFHLQARIHGFASTPSHLFSVGGYALVLGNGGYGFNVPDAVTPGTGSCSPQLVGATDITIDITRDLTPNTLYPSGYIRGEAFNTITGVSLGTCTYSITSLASGAVIKANGIILGGIGASGNIDFIRWYPGPFPANTPVQPFVNSPAPWLDYEFPVASPGIDTSGAGQLVGGLGFAPLPSYAPVCSTGAPQTVVAGDSLVLDGTGSYSLSGSASLSYSWSYMGPGSDGVTQSPAFSDTTAVTPVVSGLTRFGSFNTQLVVTDSNGHQSSCNVHNGVVIANARGAIDLTAEGLSPVQQFIVGPQVAYGRSHWPYADTAVNNELNLQYANLQNPQIYQPYWRNLQPGTVTLTGGSSTVVGSGTSFRALFCSGGQTSDGSYFILRYTGVPDGLTHYAQFQVMNCIDDAHLTISSSFSNTPVPFAYPVAPFAPWPNCRTSCAGMAYSRVDTTSVPYFMWNYNSSPANYYDNVEFFLIGYWRSGIDLYYSGANQLAQAWIEWPQLDYYYNCKYQTNNYAPGNTVLCPGESRSLALTGMILWQQMAGGANRNLVTALENAGAYYQNYMDILVPTLSAKGFGVGDMRDGAYCLSGLALLALIDTGPAQASFQASVKNALTSIFTPNLRNGTLSGWNTYYAGTSSVAEIGNGTGYVQVVSGSTLVQGIGTSFTSSLRSGSLDGSAFWSFPGPANMVPPYCGTCPNTGNVVGGDSQSYIVTAVDPINQTLTIHPPYQGQTCTGGCQRGYAIESSSGIPGWGVQPFMVGLLAQSFFHAAQAMAGYDGGAQSLYLQYGHIATEEAVSGITPDQGGLYNAAYFPGCVPPMYNTSSGTQLYCYGGVGPYQGPIWTSGAAFGNGDMSLYNNAQYRSLSEGNVGHPPDVSPAWWTSVSIVAPPAGNRQLAAELMRALAYDYTAFGTNAPVADSLMTQMFTPPTTPTPLPNYYYYLAGYDLTVQPPGYYVAALVAGSTSYDPTNAKWAGQLSGFTEAAVAWPGIVASMTSGPSRGPGRTH